jgi:hypothetical protein
VSFFGVRRLVLFNPPTSYKDYLQRIGRAFRACKSHISNLQPEDRTVAVDIYVAVIRRADVDALLDADQTVTKRTRKSADVQGGGGGGKGSKGPRTDKGKARAPSRKKSASLRGLHIPEATIDVLAAQHLQRERAVYVDFVNAKFKDIALDRGLYDGGFQPRGPFGVPASELQAEAKAQTKAKPETEANAKAEAEAKAKAEAGADNAKAEAGKKTDEKGDTEQQDSGDVHADAGRREPHEEGRGHHGRRHGRERSRRYDEYRRDRHGKRSDRHGRRSDRHGRYSDRQGRRSDRHGRRSDRHGRRSDRHGRHGDRREQGRKEPREYVRITRPRNQVQTPKTQSPRARGILGKAYDWLTSADKRGTDDPRGTKGHEDKQGKEGKGLLGLGGRWYTLGLGGGDDVRMPGLRPQRRTKVGPQDARSSGKKRLPAAARKRTSRRRLPRK